MKDSWLFYDYLQRWWRVLLLCCALGILVASLVNQLTVYAKEYGVTATLALIDPNWVPELPTLFVDSSPTQTLFTIESGPKPTQEEADAVIEAKFAQLAEYSGNHVERRGIVIQENFQGTRVWWKGPTLGAVLGLLGAIGMIYVWTDAQAYRKRERGAQSQ